MERTDMLLHVIHSTSSVIHGTTVYNFPAKNKCTEVSFRIWNIYVLQTARKHFCFRFTADTWVFWLHQKKLYHHLHHICHGGSSEISFGLKFDKYQGWIVKQLNGMTIDSSLLLPSFTPLKIKSNLKSKETRENSMFTFQFSFLTSSGSKRSCAISKKTHKYFLNVKSKLLSEKSFTEITNKICPDNLQ